MNQTNPQPNSTSPIVPVMIMMGIFAIVLAILLSGRTYVQPAVIASTPVVEATPTLLTAIEADTPTYAAADVEQGRTVFQSICAACHGSDARGIVGNGKNLVDSEFVTSLDDQELHDFIIVGRQPWDAGNTTGIAMPARGGNPILSDEDIFKVIAFIRTLKDPSLLGGESSAAASTPVPTTVSAATSTPVPTVATTATTASVGEATTVPTSAPTEVAALPPAAVEYNEANFTAGEALYTTSCSSCHHANAEGMPGMGPNLVESEFVTTSTDAELHHFIMVTGRQPWDAANTTGLACPPKGTNLSLTDAQTDQIIVYLRGLKDPSVLTVASATTEATAPEGETVVVSEPHQDFELLCAGCHGTDGNGIEEVTVPLSESDILNDDAALFTLLAHGQPEVSPATGVPHPGYWNELTPDEIRALIDYVRTLPTSD